MTKKYYVYALSKPSGEIFYIGKGTGLRMFDHEKEAALGYENLKCEMIRYLQSRNQKVTYTVLFETEDEILAYREEKRQIKLHGIDTLTNVSHGSEITYKRKVCNKQKRRLTIKLPQESLDQLRAIAAFTGQLQYKVHERIIMNEGKRLGLKE